MDFFKRQLAPLSSEAWEEINDRAKRVLKSYLSARKVVNVVLYFLVVNFICLKRQRIIHKLKVCKNKILIHYKTNVLQLTYL